MSALIRKLAQNTVSLSIISTSFVVVEHKTRRFEYLYAIQVDLELGAVLGSLA